MQEESGLVPCDLTLYSFASILAEACMKIPTSEFEPRITLLSTPKYYPKVFKFSQAYDSGKTPVKINTERDGSQWGVHVWTGHNNDKPIRLWAKVPTSNF